MYHDADTSGGNSGGPVWQYFSDTGIRRVIAVHVYGSSARNGATRLVPQNQAIIEAWMAWTPPVAPSTGSSGGGGKSGCIIATVAYGSYLNPNVQILRNFRDRYLLTNKPGREFVDLYNRYSPPVAAYIKNRDTLRTATRVILTPVVYAVKHPLGFLLVCGSAVVAVRGVHRIYDSTFLTQRYHRP
jgi:hypothetical protein